MKTVKEMTVRDLIDTLNEKLKFHELDPDDIVYIETVDARESVEQVKADMIEREMVAGKYRCVIS